jgi:hypothetical protein
MIVSIAENRIEVLWEMGFLLSFWICEMRDWMFLNGWLEGVGIFGI